MKKSIYVYTTAFQIIIKMYTMEYSKRNIEKIKTKYRIELHGK